MLARDGLKSAVKETFVPTVKAVGFSGTYPTWRVERDGDVAVVNIQSGQYNEGTHGTFYGNLAVVPPSWWAWTHECAPDTFWGSASKPGRAHDWDGLYRGRLLRPGKGQDDSSEWTVDSPAQARAAATEMTAALNDGGLSGVLEHWPGPNARCGPIRRGRRDEPRP